MFQERGEVLHSLLGLVTQIQDRSSVGMCPGPALMGKVPSQEALSTLGQAEVIEWVKELADMDLVEFPSLGRPGGDKGLFLVRVTAAGKRALQSAPSSPFWKKRDTTAESGRLGRDPNILLHQTITMEQVLLALLAGMEQSGAPEEQKGELRSLLSRAQDRAAHFTETGAGPSLTQWARYHPAQLSALLGALLPP